MQAPSISHESILEQLRKILASQGFENAGRSRALLKFVVEQTVNNRVDRLKEYTLGSEALGRGDSFDPRTDPIVRAEASRLRRRLELYYATEGRSDPVHILLPKGGYVPQFLGAAPDDRAIVSKQADSALPRPRRRGWLVAGALAVGCAAGLALWVPRRSPPPALVQFDVELKARGMVGSEVGNHVILSPDGARLVYVSLRADGVTVLNTRRLDQSEATELSGTEGARDPFFSPDGHWVGFQATDELKKTPVEGGSPVVLANVSDASFGASWGDDGNIVASLGAGKLSRISSVGGPPSVVLDVARESITPMWPQVLPGAKVVVFTAVGSSGPNEGRIEALSLPTGKRTVLARRGTYGRYLPNGYATYLNQGTLFALPVDIDRMETHGEAFPVLDGVSYSSTYGFAQIDLSRNGSLVYQKNSGGQLIAEWSDSAGQAEPFPAKPGRYFWPSLSPDGKHLALSVTESGATGVWVFQGPEPITKITPADRPIWSPDGRFLVLGGAGGLAWRLSDGDGKTQRLLGNGNIQQVPWSFSPDGKRLAYHERSSTTGFDLWTVPIRMSASGLVAGSPELFLRTPAYETYPAFSPDGRWMAYGSNVSGSWQVYVRSFPDGGKAVQVSTSGGRIARWSPNRRDLLYRTDDQRLMVAAYTVKEGLFTVQGVRQWPQLRLADTGVLSNFDLPRDGLRILALVPATRPEDRQTENHVTFMLNFFDEIKRRAEGR